MCKLISTFKFALCAWKWLFVQQTDLPMEHRFYAKEQVTLIIHSANIRWGVNQTRPIIHYVQRTTRWH